MLIIITSDIIIIIISTSMAEIAKKFANYANEQKTFDKRPIEIHI